MNGGMVHEIASLGVERSQLSNGNAHARVGGESIPYEPRELASMITTLRGFAPQTYLAIEGTSRGGWSYISKACAIPHVQVIDKTQSLLETKKALRDKEIKPFDLISIDPRSLLLSADEIWKYIQGGKESVTEFGKGAPTDYGPKKWKPGTLVIFNMSSPEGRELYFKVRTLDNRMHQSTFAGMVKL